MDAKNNNISSIMRFCLLFAVIYCLAGWHLAYADEPNQLVVDQQIDYFKLISTVEYIAKRGDEQREYRHQAEPWWIVATVPQSQTQNYYSLLTTDLEFQTDYAAEMYKDASQIDYELTDKRIMTSVDDDLMHLLRMNNECVETLEDKAVREVGKSWTCRFDMSIFNHYSLPNELKFKMDSIKVETDELGDLVAVRAISDPFLVKAAKQLEGYGYVKCQVASVYLFDPYVYDSDSEEVYVNANVFVASTKMDDMVQEYRYEFGTYKTDANQAAIDMEGLGIELEDFMKKIKLIPQPIEVNEPAGLPLWAKSEIVNAAQLSSACSAVACEQVLVNPVASIYLAAARVYQMQDECILLDTWCPRSVCQALRYDVEEIYPMDICGKDDWPLWPLIAIPIATASYHHHDHDDKSPSKP